LDYFSFLQVSRLLSFREAVCFKKLFFDLIQGASDKGLVMTFVLVHDEKVVSGVSTGAEW
jgi:hypothetical protein